MYFSFENNFDYKIRYLSKTLSVYFHYHHHYYCSEHVEVTIYQKLCMAVYFVLISCIRHVTDLMMNLESIMVGFLLKETIDHMNIFR